MHRSKTCPFTYRVPIIEAASLIPLPLLPIASSLIVPRRDSVLEVASVLAGKRVIVLAVRESSVALKSNI